MSSILLNLKTEPSPIPLFPTYGSPSSGGGGSVGSPGGCGGSGGNSGLNANETKMFLSHGGRPTKGNGRKRKGVDEYAAENRIDFTSRSIIRDGQLVRILVCRFCCQSIGARSDRIKEHLASKRHQKLKLEAFREAAEAGRDLSQEYSDDSASGLLPEPPIAVLKFPGKSLTHHLLEAEREGRQSSHELTPEPEERRQNMLTPPPLRDFRMNSPPPLAPHPNMPGIRGPAQMSTLRSSPPPPPPPRTEAPPQSQQLLCVRWGNYDSNIVSMFSKLRSAEHFVDVTLWCEGRTVKCHKIVLSACSVYFEQLLVENQHNHPIIFLKDMKFWEIEALVEFMYKGETSIHQDKLQSLLRAAESLQIKGLGSPPPGQTNPSNDINNNSSSASEVHHQAGIHRDSAPRPTRPHGLSSSTEDQSDGSMDMGLPVGNFSLTAPRGNSPNRPITTSSAQSQIMGMDLSNYSAASNQSNHLSQSSFLATTVQTPLSSSSVMNLQHSSAKRRKKETPRRIGMLPRSVHGGGAGNLPLQLLPPPYNNSFVQGDGDDDGAGSEEDSNETEPQNLIAVNGAGGGSDDDSMTGTEEPRPLIMVDKTEPLDADYGLDGDSDEGDEPPERIDT